MSRMAAENEATHKSILDYITDEVKTFPALL